MENKESVSRSLPWFKSGRVRSAVCLISIIVLSIVAYTRWFSFKIFQNADWWFFFSGQISINSTLSSWNFNGFGFDNSFLLWRKPIEVIYAIFSSMGLSSNITDFFMVFLPIIFLLPIAIYLLLKKIFRDSNEAPFFVGSAFFVFNTYFLSIDNQGDFLLTIAAALSIISFTFIFDFINNRFEKRDLFLSILFLSMSGVYDFRFLYIGFFVNLSYVFFMCRGQWNLKIKTFFLLAFGIFLLFSFYLLPSLSAHSLIENAASSRTLFGNGFFDLMHALALYFPYWTGGSVEWFQVHKIHDLFWVIPIVATLGLILNRKNKNVLFFGVLALIGVFLSKQVAEPFPFVYGWLFGHFIGFNAFREASKFYFLAAVGYSVLITSFMDWIWKNWNRTRIQLAEKYILTCLIAGIFLWNIKPIITGEIGAIYMPRAIPDDYFVLNEFILKEGGYFRTLWIPASSRWGIYSESNPKIDGATAIQDTWSDFSDLTNNLPPNLQITSFLDNPAGEQLLNNSSIRYVIVPTHDVTYDDLFAWYGNNREYFINKLDRIPFLKKIYIGTSNLAIYENRNYRPHLYITNKEETVYKKLPYEVIDFEQQNPAKYAIDLSNITAPVYLNFSESFNSGWKLRAGDFDWFSVLVNKNYFLDDGDHFQNDADLNSFLIDPQKICKDFQCTKNNDGSYNIDLTLYFQPQSYFYLGLIISGATLLTCLGYLGWDFMKKKKTKSGL